MVKNMFKVKTNGKNKISMPELVKIDLLFVKIAQQHLTGTDGGHFEERCFLGLSSQNRDEPKSPFLISPSKQVRVQPFFNDCPFKNHHAFISTRNALPASVYKHPGIYKRLANMTG